MGEDPEEDPEYSPMEDPSFGPQDAEGEFPPPQFSAAVDWTDEGIIWRDIEMYPLPTVRSPSPPMPPLSPLGSEDGYEEFSPASTEHTMEAAADPGTPPPPLVGVPVGIHEYMMGQLTAELAVANDHVQELRDQLGMERELRVAQQRGMIPFTAQQMRTALTRIELRARVRMRGLPTGEGVTVSLREAEGILADAMMQAHDLTRPTE